MLNELNSFLEDKRKVLADATLTGYRKSLSSFLRDAFEAGLREWGEVDTQYVESWIARYSQSGVKPVTVQIRVIHLRQFFEWLHRRGFILSNPISKEFYSKKIPRPLIKAPSIKDMERSIEKSNVAMVNYHRNRAIVELFYSTGIRKGEISRLDITDVMGSEIRVLGKGGKERLVPIGLKAKKALDLYIQGERMELLKRHNPGERALFISRNGGGRLEAGSFSAVLRSAMNLKFGPHAIRRACATHMIQNGASLRTLQKMLGHTNMAVTKQYTALDISDLRKACLRYHPRW